VGHRAQRPKEVPRYDHYGESVQGEDAITADEPRGDIFRTDLPDDGTYGSGVAALYVFKRQEHLVHQRRNPVLDAVAARRLGCQVPGRVLEQVQGQAQHVLYQPRMLHCVLSFDRNYRLQIGNR